MIEPGSGIGDEEKSPPDPEMPVAGAAPPAVWPATVHHEGYQ